MEALWSSSTLAPRRTELPEEWLRFGRNMKRLWQCDFPNSEASLRSGSKRMTQLCRLPLRREGYTTSASCHFLTGMATGHLYKSTFTTYWTGLAWSSVYGRTVTSTLDGSGEQGLSLAQLPSSHFVLSTGRQLSNVFSRERCLWFQRCLGQSLDESGGQILCFSPPGQCFQSDSKQGNV